MGDPYPKSNVVLIDGKIFFLTPTGAVPVGDPTDLAAYAASLFSFLAVTADHDAQDGQKINANTSEGPFTITLPEVAVFGVVIVLDDGGTGNALTIDGNGATIEGEDTDDTLQPGHRVTFSRTAAASAWTLSFGV